MKLKFWKKDVIKKVEKKLYSVIEISFKNGAKIRLRNSKFKGITPWIGFYKWYFFRESPCYSLNYNTGRYLIERKDIFLVNIFDEMDF